MKNPINERIKDVMDYFNLTVTEFSERLSIPKSTFATILSKDSEPKAKFLNSIIEEFDTISAEWLLLGKGNMIKGYAITEKKIGNNSVPYWNLLVSAGKSLFDVVGKVAPDGYVTGLPGADMAENILPVVGMSMFPDIMPSALIGVRKVNNWETLNTERVYLIITIDDRMIKRIEHDLEDDNILWCVSPNYPKFKIYKSEIVDIQRVCFVYNPI